MGGYAIKPRARPSQGRLRWRMRGCSDRSGRRAVPHAEGRGHAAELEVQAFGGGIGAERHACFAAYTPRSTHRGQAARDGHEPSPTPSATYSNSDFELAAKRGSRGVYDIFVRGGGRGRPKWGSFLRGFARASPRAPFWGRTGACRRRLSALNRGLPLLAPPWAGSERDSPPNSMSYTRGGPRRTWAPIARRPHAIVAALCMS